MQGLLSRLAAPAAVSLGALLLIALHGPAPEPPAATERVRGASLGMFATRADYDYGTMIGEIADRGATDVLIVVPWTQSHRLAVDPGPGSISPTWANVERTIDQARDRGMRVGVMPIVRLPREGEGRWRGNLDPVSVDAWFGSYRAALTELAQRAERRGVERLVIGSELLSLERHDEAWRGVAGEVRSHFGGRIAYATNWDDLDVPFADALDELGVSAYFPMAGPTERVTERAAAARWAQALDRIRAFEVRSGKPVVLTEVGYPSRADAARAPWREDPSAALDPTGQARLLETFCRAAAEDRRVAGYYVWNWFGFGGPSDGGYSPRGKPGAAVLERCWARRTEA